ncbi:MAG TPA: hypothetical protein VFS00_09020 [Polyangiaceae bacterium]|nr:hypothetical protein [Polyangiaceae bacterium]
MAFYDDKLSAFRAHLNERGYDLSPAFSFSESGDKCPVTVRFPRALLGEQSVIAIPDVHLSDGGPGDIFFNGDSANPIRLANTLWAIYKFLGAEGAAATALQLGDWYDVWRAVGHDATQAQFGAIDNVEAYQKVLELDHVMSLAHVIGNHDASFTHALPDRRVANGERFRFGFGLLQSRGKVFALHGHQVDDLPGVPSPDSEQRIVWLATLAATYVTSQARSLQTFIDREGAAGALGWLTSIVGLNRADPVPKPRPRASAPPGIEGDFVEREQSEALVKIAVGACKQRYQPAPAELELLLVGHSHKPCVAWAPHPDSGRPVVIVDAGSWVYGAAQLLFGAGDRVSVFDVYRR